MTPGGQDDTDREIQHSGLLLFGADLSESCYRLQLLQKMQSLLLILMPRDMVTSGKRPCMKVIITFDVITIFQI